MSVALLLPDSIACSKSPDANAFSHPEVRHGRRFVPVGR
jgi:hypothetical protein